MPTEGPWCTALLGVTLAVVTWLLLLLMAEVMWLLLLQLLVVVMQLLAVVLPTTPVMVAAERDSSIDYIYALKKDSGGNLSDGVPLSLV